MAMRGYPHVVQVKEDYSVWTTIVIPSVNVDQVDRYYEYRGFCYCIGMGIPGASNGAIASRGETNLHCANMFVDGQFLVNRIDLAIPQRVLARYQKSSDFGDYNATKADLTFLTAHGLFGFYAGSDKPLAEFKLDSQPVGEDKLGNYFV